MHRALDRNSGFLNFEHVFLGFNAWLQISFVSNSRLAKLRKPTAFWPLGFTVFLAFAYWKCFWQFVQGHGLEMLTLHHVFNSDSLSNFPGLGSSVFSMFPNMFDSDSIICLHVLSHWTRCKKGSWLRSYILKSPMCGTEWTLIRYVVCVHALFHCFSVHIMHGLTLVYIYIYIYIYYYY